MGDTARLKTSRKSGNEIVIDCLEEALKRAKAGEFVSVCIAAESVAGDSRWIKGGLYSTASMVGLLELAKLDVMEGD